MRCHHFISILTSLNLVENKVVSNQELGPPMSQNLDNTVYGWLSALKFFRVSLLLSLLIQLFDCIMLEKVCINCFCAIRANKRVLLASLNAGLPNPISSKNTKKIRNYQPR